RDAQRAASLAAEYVTQLDRVVTSLSNSAAHKERVFLERRLTEADRDLETAEKTFSAFASKNTAIDIKEQGRAMLGTAAQIEGQLIAAQTELQALRQLYTDSNARVRTTEARIDELKRQLQKLGGTAAQGESPAFTNSRDAEYPSIRQL